jgi:RNA polymerase sigma factor (sigma-70 family)
MARQALSSVVDQARIEASRTVPDAELLEQLLQNRDETAFAALVRRHRPMVLSACRQVLPGDADVEDAAQQTFLALWRNARSIRNRQSVGGWLFGVAHRLAVKELSLTLRRRQVERRAGRSRSKAADAPDMSWREACAILHEELNRLTDKHRLPLLLCYLDGKSRDEAAKQLGWSVNSLRGHLERGRTRLRARLARRGVTLSAGLLAAAAGTQAPAGPTLPTAAILHAVMEQTPHCANDFWKLAWATRGVRRLVLLGAMTFGVAAGGVRLATLSHEDPPAPPRPQVQAATEPPKIATGQVTVLGRVLDPDGKPVAGATLYTLRMRTGKIPFLAEEDLDTIAHRATGSDGRFRFDVPKEELGKDPGNDPWPIMAAADGYGLGWTATSASGEELIVRLVKDQPIVGRLLDSEGRPVPNANLHIQALFTDPDDRLDAFLNGWKVRWNDAWGHVQKRTLPPGQTVKISPTDRDGRFRITGAGADRLVILDVAAPGMVKATLYIVNRASFDPKPYNQAAANLRPSAMRGRGDTPMLYGSTFDFVAEPGKTISGVVRTADGQPVEGAHVGASTLGLGTGIVTATTTADGRFTLTGLAKRPSYQVGVTPEINSPFLGRSIMVPDTDGLQPVTTEVTLVARAVIVTGRVIDQATGNGVLSSLRFAPLPDNTMFKKPGYDSYKHNRAGTATDKDGKFNLKIIPGPGVLIVQANSGESLDGQYLNPYMLATFDAEDRKHVKVIEDGRNGYFAGADNSYESLVLQP